MKLPAKVRMFDEKTSKPSGEYCPNESGDRICPLLLPLPRCNNRAV